jgi:hypothetical protein
MLKVSVSPFGLVTVGVNPYTDPTLIEVLDRPEIVGCAFAASVAAPAELVGGEFGVVTRAAGGAFSDPWLPPHALSAIVTSAHSPAYRTGVRVTKSYIKSTSSNRVNGR